MFTNACESDVSKIFSATDSLWYIGVATFSSGDETTDTVSSSQ